jgi:hypothetical protein
MIKLNQTTTKLLFKFLNLVKDVDEAEIQLEDHFPLRIDRGPRVKSDEGVGFILGIGVIHDKARRTYEHRMEFLIIDLRIESIKKGKVLAYPVSFQDDINKIFEESCKIKGNKVEECLPAYQRSHANLAYQWFLDLRTAGYI